MFAALAAASLGSALIGADSADDAADSQTAAANAATAEERRQFNLNRKDLAPYRDAGSSAVTSLMKMMGLGGGGTIDENDPRYQAIKQQVTAQIDAEHQKRYGMSVFDPRSWQSTGQSNIDEDVTRESRRLFIDQYGDPSSQQQGGGELTRKFTVNDFWADPVTKLGYQAGLDQGEKAIGNMAGARGMKNSSATIKDLMRFGTDYSGQKAGESYGRFYGDQDRTFNRLSGIAGTGQTAATNTASLGSQSAGRVGDIMTSAGNARGASAIAKGNAFSGALNTVGNWWSQNQMLDKILNRGGGGYIPPTPYAFGGT
jgi:hypothetical protein